MMERVKIRRCSSMRELSDARRQETKQWRKQKASSVKHLEADPRKNKLATAERGRGI